MSEIPVKKKLEILIEFMKGVKWSQDMLTAVARTLTGGLHEFVRLGPAYEVERALELIEATTKRVLEAAWRLEMLLEEMLRWKENLEVKVRLEGKGGGGG